MKTVTKVYRNAGIDKSTGNLHYGCMVLGLELSKPLKHGLITVETKPQGGRDDNESHLGDEVVRITQDDDVLFDVPL